MRTIVSAVGSRMVAHVRGTILLPQIPHLSQGARANADTVFFWGEKWIAVSPATNVTVEHSCAHLGINLKVPASRLCPWFIHHVDTTRLFHRCCYDGSSALWIQTGLYSGQTMVLHRSCDNIRFPLSIVPPLQISCFLLPPRTGKHYWVRAKNWLEVKHGWCHSWGLFVIIHRLLRQWWGGKWTWREIFACKRVDARHFCERHFRSHQKEMAVMLNKQPIKIYIFVVDQNIVAIAFY